MLGGAVGLPAGNHKQLHRPTTPIDLDAWREALLQSAKNQVRAALVPGVNFTNIFGAKADQLLCK